MSNDKPKFKQVVTITPEGSLAGLDRRPGQGIDLKQFGRAEVMRSSLIEWDADTQCWFIRLLPLPFTNIIVSLEFIYENSISEDKLPPPYSFRKSDGAYTFKEYDDAVAFEIAVLDALRLQGKIS